jgi:catechol 2,3-dioxygenase-like lactoylglutathione lyase family enzyme
MLHGRIHTAHPVYYVQDLVGSLRFYRDRLGLAVDWTMPEQKLAEIRLNGGATIVVCENGTKPAGASAPVLVFNIDDVDAAYARLRAGGVTFESEPSDEFYARAVVLRDADGYRLCLVSPRRRADDPQICNR